jgi:hypothetical protein
MGSCWFHLLPHFRGFGLRHSAASRSGRRCHQRGHRDGGDAWLASACRLEPRLKRWRRFLTSELLLKGNRILAKVLFLYYNVIESWTGFRPSRGRPIGASTPLGHRTTELRLCARMVSCRKIGSVSLSEFSIHSKDDNEEKRGARAGAAAVRIRLYL